jgi:hypothetical protein
MHRLRLVPLFAVVTLVAGCAATGSGGQSGTVAGVMVEVDNATTSALEVTVVLDQTETRLGRTQIGDTARFRVPATLLQAPPYYFAIRLVARDGTGSFTTPILTVQDGQRVYIDAGPTLSTSRFSVR